jgi:soluble lytic murein transglycosylase
MSRLLSLNFSLALSFIMTPLITATPRSQFKTARPQFVISKSLATQSRGDDALATVRRLDRENGGAGVAAAGQLSAAEHLRRGNIYLTNRVFKEARAHFQTLIDSYPDDANVPAALYGIGRSYFVPRFYAESLPAFERLARDYTPSKDGREGLWALATSLLRMGRAADAVASYTEYVTNYPQGERVEAAYLNVIDALREAGRPAEALEWVTRTRAKYAGTATDTNALFARLRLDISESDWQRAVQDADELRRSFLNRTGVQTNAQEIAYLRAYSLGRMNRADEAFNAYLAIPDTGNSYYGALSTARLLSLSNAPSNAARRTLVNTRAANAHADIAAHSTLYPAPYREAILRATASRKVDPRLVLAIMRQESSFRLREKSPAAARGLLQLTIDVATKYAARAGINNLQEDDLYRPETSILVGAEYLNELARLFPDVPEALNVAAVAASYNGGEDNVTRWLKRARHKDAGIFTAEIGFSETKDYVNKVISNYRAYCQLYTSNLQRH